MERARVFRRMRIAVAGICLAACVLLTALWLMSYRSFGSVKGNLSSTKAFEFVSANGRLLVFGASSTNASWRKLLNMQVQTALQMDPAFTSLTQHLSYLQMQRGLINARTGGQSRGLVAADRRIALLNNQIQQYRNQIRQQMTQNRLNTLALAAPQSGSPPNVLNRVGFGFRRLAVGWVLEVPYWFPVVLTGTLAALLGVKRWRFSLRTLLVITALVAVLLGMLTLIGR